MDEIVKLPIVYRMKKKNCTAESFIELPVEKWIYDSLVKEMSGVGVDLEANEGKIPKMIRAALKAVVKLQGFTMLTAIILDIKIRGDKHICKYCGGIAEGTYEDLLARTAGKHSDTRCTANYNNKITANRAAPTGAVLRFKGGIDGIIQKEQQPQP